MDAKVEIPKSTRACRRLYNYEDELYREMQTAHKKDLDARNELISLLKEKLKRDNTDVDDDKCPELLNSLKKQVTEESRDSFAGVVRLPSLSKFSGDEKDDDAFIRWIRKLEKHAELQKWTEREKQLHFELLLTG